MSHIDIIILSLENVGFTKQCVKSIKDYTTLPYHIIIVDNGSSQETIDELKKIDGVKLILNSINKGFAGGNNIGIKECNGEYVVLLNNDTKVTKGWLEEMVKMAESDDRIGIVGCKLLYPDDTIQHAGIKFRGLSPFHIGVGLPKKYYCKPKECKAVTFACVLIKRKLFDSGIWLDERYYPAVFEDIDFCFQALQKGWKIMYCPSAIVYHYESITLKSNFQKQRYEIIKRNLLRLKQKWKDNAPVKPKVKILRIAYDSYAFIIDKINIIRLIIISSFFRLYFHLKLKPLKIVFDHLTNSIHNINKNKMGKMD